MKKLIGVVTAALVAVTLTGCSVGTVSTPSGSHNSWVSTGDGRIVYCISIGQSLSCDWGNAQEKE